MTFSTKQYFERMGSSDQLHTDDPMDAGYAWTLTDNVQHLIDESPKYRINFLHSTVDAQRLHNYNSGFASISMYFWTDVFGVDRYPRYDVRVAFLNGGGGTTTVRASIVTPTVASVNGESGEFGVLGTFTGVTPATGAEWTIDGTVGDVNVAACPIYIYPAVRFEGQEAVISNHALLKLLVEWEYELGEGIYNASLVGAQVREYIT